MARGLCATRCPSGIRATAYAAASASRCAPNLVREGHSARIVGRGRTQAPLHGSEQLKCRAASTAPHEASVEGETRAVNIAIASNVLIFTAKLVVSQTSGSSALLSEAVHTLADIGNQLLLRLGIARSKLAPTSQYPYGYMKDKFIFSLISAVGVFCIGAGASVLNGFHALADTDHDVDNFGLSFAVLAVGFVVEGFSCAVAVRALMEGAARRGMSLWEYLDSGSDPATVAVMAEDGAAVLGVLMAAASTWLVKATEWQAWDGVGSILVGILLALVALFLIQRNRSVLIGRAMNSVDQQRVITHLNRDPVVNRVYDARSEEIGPGVYRFSAELDFKGDVITARHLSTVDQPKMLRKFLQTGNARNPDDTRAFSIVMKEYGSQLVRAVAEEVDRIEAEIKALVPGVQYVDLESDRGRFNQYRQPSVADKELASRWFDTSRLSWDAVKWERESDRIDFLLQESESQQQAAAGDAAAQQPAATVSLREDVSIAGDVLATAPSTLSVSIGSNGATATRVEAGNGSSAGPSPSVAANGCATADSGGQEVSVTVGDCQVSLNTDAVNTLLRQSHSQADAFEVPGMGREAADASEDAGAPSTSETWPAPDRDVLTSPPRSPRSTT